MEEAYISYLSFIAHSSEIRRPSRIEITVHLGPGPDDMTISTADDHDTDTDSTAQA